MKHAAWILFAACSSGAFAQSGVCWKEPQPPAPGSPAPKDSLTYGFKLKAILDAKTTVDIATAVDDLVHIELTGSCFAEFAGQTDAGQRKVLSSLIKAFENARTDKQAGAGATGTGTTTAVTRGASAKALGFAAESGALTQSVKGQVVTFTGNLAGLPDVLVRNSIVEYCNPRFEDNRKSCISSNAFRFLRTLSFGVSFDASRDQTTTGTATAGATSGGSASTTATPVTFQATRNELSSVTGRFDIINKRDVTSAAFQKKWLDQIKTDQTLKAPGEKLGAAITCLFSKATEGAACSLGAANLVANDDYKAWFKSATDKLTAARRNNADFKTLSALWLSLLEDLVKTLQSSSKAFQDAVNLLRASFETFDFAEDTFINSIGTQPLLTFEYTNNRPVGQSSTSTFRWIGEFGWAQNNNLTFNFGTTIFDSAQPAMPGISTSRLRDLEAGVQYERKLGQLSLLGAAALDASVYFQNQKSDSLLKVDPTNPISGVTFVGLPSNAQTVFAKRGNIGLAQLRLVLGPGSSNVRVPIAVSYSNRTELIAKPTWRAQVGISYDFDALFSK